MHLERDLIFALSRLKVTSYSGDDEGELHEGMLKTLFVRLTETSRGYRGTIGNHWEDIGFQGSDPRTDIRGAGILGVL